MPPCNARPRRGWVTTVSSGFGPGGAVYARYQMLLRTMRHASETNADTIHSRRVSGEVSSASFGPSITVCASTER
jgi:hypothetical protein